MIFTAPRGLIGCLNGSAFGGGTSFPGPRGLSRVRQQKRRRDFTNSLHRQQAHSHILPLAKKHRRGYNEKRAQLYLLCGRGTFSCIGPGGVGSTLPACLFCCLIDIIPLSLRKCKRAFLRKRGGGRGKRNVSPGK